MRIVDFIESSNQCSSQQDLVLLFEKTICSFGIDKFVYSLARGSFKKNGKTLHGLVRSYPEDWMKHYGERGCINYDPTYRYAMIRKGSFTWRGLGECFPLRKKEKQLMAEAEEAGLGNGVTVAIHGPYGEIIGFGFASENRNDKFNKNELSELYAIANQFHITYSDLDEPEELPDLSLSERQKEILQWAAVGKSRSLIAEIIGISEDTVDDHYRHIFKKLECNDRTVAVLKAIQYGLVRI